MEFFRFTCLGGFLLSCIIGCTVKDFSSWFQYSNLLEQQTWHPATEVRNAVSPLVFEQSTVRCSFKHKVVQQVCFLGLEILPEQVDNRNLKPGFKRRFQGVFLYIQQI